MEIHLPQPELQNQVIQALSDAQLLDKVSINTYRDCDRPKCVQVRHRPIPHHVYQVEKLEDGSLYCSDLGQKLPLNQKGKIDMDKLGQLVLENSLKRISERSSTLV